MIHWPDLLLAALVATLVWLIICRPWPHEQHGLLASEVDADGLVPSVHAVSPGLTAPVGVDTCTCDPEFYPDAIDADCPLHGIVPFSRSRVFDQARTGS